MLSASVVVAGLDSGFTAAPEAEEDEDGVVVAGGLALRLKMLPPLLFTGAALVLVVLLFALVLAFAALLPVPATSFKSTSSFMSRLGRWLRFFAFTA